MSAASGDLQRVKRAFESHGITNDVEIAGSVAFLLLAHDRWDEIKDKPGANLTPELESFHAVLQRKYPGLQHVPKPPQTVRFGLESLGEVLSSLQEAISASPWNTHLGDFFQREVRFELLKSTSGDQYTRPQHIAVFLAALAISRLSLEVFD